MSLSVVWNQQAQITFDLILQHIDMAWGERETTKFFNDTQRVLKLISRHPYLYKSSEVNISVRKALISKQTSLFYQVEENRIVLLYFWDNRQYPMF